MCGTPLFYSRSIRSVLFLIIILYITHIITVALQRAYHTLKIRCFHPKEDLPDP